MKAGESALIEALTCKKDDSVKQVARLLKDNERRHILVLDENEYPVGLVSTTDMNNKVVADGLDVDKTNAEDIMTTPIDVCQASDELTDVYVSMHKNNRFSCPVVEQGKLKGLLTFKEAFKDIVKMKSEGAL